jgi:MFS family permease
MHLSTYTTREQGALRVGIYGAVATLVGILLSGPIGLLVVSAVHPSPPWQDAATYAQSYAPIQTLPFFGGFLLVGGYVVLMAAIYQIAQEEKKAATLTAVMFTAVFATLIFFNYVNQTTFVPALARDYKPEYAPIISTFALANPRALCWAIEMWGYALLGVATWLAAPIFGRDRLERVTAALMVLNGVLSIAGGFVTSLDLAWVMTLPGLMSYAGWNVVVFALSACVAVALHRRQVHARALAAHPAA